MPGNSSSRAFSLRIRLRRSSSLTLSSRWPALRSSPRLFGVELKRLSFTTKHQTSISQLFVLAQRYKDRAVRGLARAEARLPESYCRCCGRCFQARRHPICEGALAPLFVAVGGPHIRNTV